MTARRQRLPDHDVSVNSEATNTVVILGAGFSKAVFAKYPTTDELGEAVREHLSVNDRTKFPASSFSDGRFEEWLSYLSETQPHFKLDDTHEAAALVIRVTRAISQVLSGIQRAALMTPPPSWFFELLSCLHVDRSTVISLNYDNLVECGVQTMGVKRSEWFGPTEVAEDDILRGLPPRANFPGPVDRSAPSPWLLEGSSTSASGPRAETFRLLKLHGSLSWYWLPGGGGSSTLRRWQLPGIFGEFWDLPDGLLYEELPSHEVFIVPPAALKGERLREPVTRELWHRAAEALSVAQRVVLVGYSVPLADHSVSGMLADALAERTVQVEIVNLHPGPVQDRLGRLGLRLDNSVNISGEGAVGRWTAEEVKRLARKVARSLRVSSDFSGEEVLFVDSPREERIRKFELAPTSDVLRLMLNGRGQQLTRPVQQKDVRDAMMIADSVVVNVDGRDHQVIDFWTRPEGAGGLMAQLHLALAGI